MNTFCIRLGCFLTGYNYAIVRNASEMTAKVVKKYLASLLIIGIVWGFIGYTFTERYLHSGIIGSVIGAIIMIFIVIQIERQVILSFSKNSWGSIFRCIIGIIMAMIGSTILDQKMFKDDVERHQVARVEGEVNRILPIKTQQLSQQIAQIEQAINKKESERTLLIDEITKRPMISSVTTSLTKGRDNEQSKMVTKEQQITNQSIPNPKANLIPHIDEQIKTLNNQKSIKEHEVLNARQQIEKEIREKQGFLDELTVLWSIITSSAVAFTVWSLIFLFFFFIELFVLINKTSEQDDYHTTVLHQMNFRIKRLEQLNNNNDRGDAWVQQ